ncbi:hypothetical protein CKAH01_03968 [Colletotrichum kahawae]|uniref:Uncharacterized protein n=1 Tax=Colletotrichum kahawae TaxID=34407 RepID=A0AAD9YLR3_COLKA|nr:hypothetical protein CKAH01_03968 [Colletotrichum kahawae]
MHQSAPTIGKFPSPIPQETRRGATPSHLQIQQALLEFLENAATLVGPLFKSRSWDFQQATARPAVDPS